MNLFFTYFLSLKFFPSLLIAMFLFAIHAERKEYFALRLSLSATVTIVLSEMIWLLLSNYSGESKKYLYLLSVCFYVVELYAVCAVCFQIKPLEGILYVTGGMITEHLANGSELVVSYAFQIVSGKSLSEFGNFVVTLFVFVIVYLAVVLIFRYLWKDKAELSNPKILIPFFVMLFVVIILTIFKPYTKQLEFMVTLNLYDISCCIVALVLCSYAFENGSLHYKLDLLTELEKKTSEQYEAMRDSIDLINTKSHDLKKIVSLLEKGGGSISEEAFSEINKGLFFYDVAIKTGNKAFDTIITEKSLLCEKNGVEFLAVAETERLHFMDDLDVYSIFANMLDNAYEATVKLPEGQRMISLRVREEGNLLVVHLENTFGGKVEYRDGRLITSKGDADEHGFGMLSIQRAIKKYGGEMNVSIGNGLFEFDIVIPLT